MRIVTPRTHSQTVGQVHALEMLWSMTLLANAPLGLFKHDPRSFSLLLDDVAIFTSHCNGGMYVFSGGVLRMAA